MIEPTQPPLVILSRVADLLSEAQQDYERARNTKGWKYYEGRWDALVDAYKIAVEVLADVEREQSREHGGDSK